MLDMVTPSLLPISGITSLRIAITPHPCPAHPPGALGSPTHVKQHPLAPADKHHHVPTVPGWFCPAPALRWEMLVLMGRVERKFQLSPAAPTQVNFAWGEGLGVHDQGDLALRTLSPSHDQCRV